MVWKPAAIGKVEIETASTIWVQSVGFKIFPVVVSYGRADRDTVNQERQLYWLRFSDAVKTPTCDAFAIQVINRIFYETVVHGG